MCNAVWLMSAESRSRYRLSQSGFSLVLFLNCICNPERWVWWRKYVLKLQFSNLICHSFVDFCELKPSTGDDAMCDPLVFSARSNGDDVTFRFEFRRINGNLDEDHVTIVTANTTTSSVSNVGLSQEARLEFTFQGEVARWLISHFSELVNCFCHLLVFN